MQNAYFNTTCHMSKIKLEVQVRGSSPPPPLPLYGKKNFKSKRTVLHLNLTPEGSENCPGPSLRKVGSASESDSKTSALHFDLNVCHPQYASFLTDIGSSFPAFKQKGMHRCKACHSGRGLQRTRRGRQFKLCQGNESHCSTLLSRYETQVCHFVTKAQQFHICECMLTPKLIASCLCCNSGESSSKCNQRFYSPTKGAAAVKSCVMLKRTLFDAETLSKLDSGKKKLCGARAAGEITSNKNGPTH